MPYIKKATADEIRAYRDKPEPPVYPLGYHAIGVLDTDGNKHTIAVEDLRGFAGEWEPTWELIAPSGYHFDIEYVHTKLCYGLSDVRSQISNLRLKKCDPAIRCGCEHGG